MSSRIIVKNLPGKVTEMRLRELFSSCGEVTDVKLMKTKKGTFRKFGFIGFSSEDQAQSAVSQFHKTFIDASKVEVEIARPYQDPQLARPWSKYSIGSSAHTKHEKELKKKKKTNDDEVKDSKEVEKPSNELVQKLEECDRLEEDPDFMEFLDLHQHSSHVQTWRDQAGADTQERIKKTKPVDSDDTDGQEDGDEEDPVVSSEEDPAISVEKSDMEYLKSKMMTSDSGMESESSLESESDTSESDQEPETESTRLATTPHTLKMLGLPFKATEKDVHDFFHPLKVISVRFTVDPEGRPSGRAYVDFQTAPDLNEGLKRHKDCIGRRYIELFEDTGPVDLRRERGGRGSEKPRPWEMRGTSDTETESIADSGRLFIRNLSYAITEEDLTKLFERHGPLTEVTVHLDKKTNKPTGIAFITFMLPEHAVKAFEALDGQIFQGRLLHILPAKTKRSSNESTPSSQHPGSSFKKKKELKIKAESGVGHNWNTLFLGANAVVDAMADRYSADKSSILDPSSQGSAAVRLALGETQLNSETREFLESHGVRLELFEQSKPKRSKTIILVKNMAFGTTESELHSLFSPFGTLRQVVLPPSGISALVEFTDPGHARTAFKKLAYTNFKHLPLYLEWAPVGVIGTPLSGVGADSALKDVESEQATVFVKNLNFSSSESSLKELFSKVGNVASVSIARKHGAAGSSAHLLSMGYGFVEFKTHGHALEAIKTLQHAELDGHQLELKLSHRESQQHSSGHSRKMAKPVKQVSAKILVRNVPFEASKKEMKELFRTFGELKSVRLPQKFSVSEGDHRGFAFVEFLTKEDAKRAFDSLSHSTHLYGRRLVLEWAEQEESVEAIRKRTAEHFHGFQTSSAKKKRTELLQNTLDKT